MLTSVAIVADTRASAVDASLQALLSAVAQAEAAGTTVEIIVVDSSGRPDVADLLRGIEGAGVVPAPGTARVLSRRARPLTSAGCPGRRHRDPGPPPAERDDGSAVLTAALSGWGSGRRLFRLAEHLGDAAKPSATGGGVVTGDSNPAQRLGCPRRGHHAATLGVPWWKSSSQPAPGSRSHTELRSASRPGSRDR
jgi:hypothetical protein